MDDRKALEILSKREACELQNSEMCRITGCKDCPNLTHRNEDTEAIQIATEALRNQSILLELLCTIGSEYICGDVNARFCAKHCTSVPDNECYLAYCKSKREEAEKC